MRVSCKQGFLQTGRSAKRVGQTIPLATVGDGFGKVRVEKGNHKTNRREAEESEGNTKCRLSLCRCPLDVVLAGASSSARDAYFTNRFGWILWLRCDGQGNRWLGGQPSICGPPVRWDTDAWQP